MGGARRRRAPLSLLAAALARVVVAAAAAAAWALAPAALAAEAPFGVEQLMSALATRSESAVRFTETRRSGALREPLVTTGELRYRRTAGGNERLERRVQTPFAERYVIEDDRVTVERGGAAHTLRLDAAPVLRVFIESIRATLAGDLEALRRHYAVTLYGARDDWVLALLPADPEVAELVTSVRIAGAADRIRSMEVLEASGDRVETRFGDEISGRPG
jgi:hypothetical protein